MALNQISYNAPDYTALSTDIVNNKISGLCYIGAKVYISDIQQWKIVNPDLTLSDYFLSTSGGGNTNLITVNVSTSPYTIIGFSQLVLCDCTNGNIILNLPTLIGNNGKQILVKKIDASTNTVTITPFGSETIDGKSSMVIQYQNSSVTLVSNNVTLDIV